MPKATAEAGTELLLDSETITPGTTWSDAAAGSEVFRQGPLVTIALRVKNVARAAWEKKKYKEGELATEGGHTYRAEGSGLVAKETDENKPSTKPTMWKDLGLSTALTRVCTLPKLYWPKAALKDKASGSTFEVKENGEVVTLESVEAAAEHLYSLTYRAATLTP